ncbi:MAG: TIGR00159 family protein [Chloroflexi bacterium]|nr:TIGR00159 family protein [Chloroflexota bacterium]
MSELTTAIGTILGRLDPRSVVEIFIVACLIYGLLLLLRGTTAMALLRGIGALFLVGFGLSTVFQLPMLGWLLRSSLPAMLIVIPVLFQPELRRVLEQVGRGLRGFAAPSLADSVEVVEAIVRAARVLSERRYGALIVLERDTGLQEYSERGVPLDALSSSELLISMFAPSSPLHDGAIILRRGRVVAARCTLPLSENLMERRLGTRHRAGIGISERTDAVAVLVSEETGRISLAADGRLLSLLDETELRVALLSLLGPRRLVTPGGEGWDLFQPERMETPPQPAERKVP